MPRKAISWSSYSLFRRSVAQWIKVYIYGFKFESEAILFGRKFAEALEAGGHETGDADVDFALAFMPRYPKVEHKIDVRFRKVAMHGRPDGCDIKRHLIGEYKTGKVEWTQSRVDKEGQLTWYAMVYYLKYGVIPKLELHWYDTQNRMVKTFKTTRTMTQVLLMANDAVRVNGEMIKVCEAEYSKLG